MKDKSDGFPKYSNVETEKFENEGEFMDALVELLKQSIELIYRVVEIKYCNNEDNLIINKEESIVAGNLTRLIKLNISFLQNICENRLEICQILNRCLAETYINLKFIIIKGEESVLKNYIKNSLITEKELWETILTNIKGNNDNTLPIEIRMQNSIKRSFDESDFELVNVNRSSKWKSIKERANLVAGDMFYNVFYGVSSHAIHGNWQDILSNNLNKVDEGFKVNLNWNKPRPQIMEATIFFNLDIVKTFAN